MVKATDEQPGEDAHRAKSGRVLNAAASVSVEPACATLPVWMCSTAWQLPESCAIGVLWRHPHIDNRYLHF